MKQTKQESKKEEQPVIEPKLQEAVEAAENWKNKYIRALADYQNLEKRTDEEKSEVRMYATKLFLTQLLPIIDNLERAEDHIKDEGLSIVMKELHALLGKHEVKKLDVVGTAFDPYTMECTEVVEGEKNQVMEVVSAGYTMHGKLLREAKVKVGAGSTQKTV